MRADKITETQDSVSNKLSQIALAEVQADYADLEGRFTQVQERLQGMDMLLNNIGWSEIYGTNPMDFGPDLQQVQHAAWELQALTAQNAHLKRGNLLRTNYVWEGGIHYENIPGSKQGRGTNVQSRIDDPRNQREFFGPGARKKRSKALYTDGHAIYMGDDATRTLKAISFLRVSGILTNPNDASEVWAFRIQTTSPELVDNQKKILNEWVFLDEYADLAQYQSSLPQTSDPVAKGKRLFVRYANPTTGWTWGTPDALAAMAWVRQYREFLLSGKKMSDAMAMLWAQVKSPTQQGAANASIQFGNKQGAGGVAVGGPEMAPLSTAGKGYDFDSGRALLAAAATSLEVSVVALASDPGAAGSSYGSAQTLDLPGRMAISAIRDDEAEFDETVLRWLGAPDAKAWFDTLLDAEQIYRAVQAEMLYWSTGTRSGEEQKREMDRIKGKPVNEPIPDGLMIPNNTNFPGTLSNDSVPQQAASPDQGQANGAGNSGGVGNIRNDTVSK